jgi:hypothetical protein
MSQNTKSTPTHLEFGFWLVFNSTGDIRLTRGRPSCTRDEHSMKMVVSLPKSLWQQPQLSGHITITDPAAPINIDVTAASEALSTALGVDIDLRIQSPEPVSP